MVDLEPAGVLPCQFAEHGICKCCPPRTTLRDVKVVGERGKSQRAHEVALIDGMLVDAPDFLPSIGARTKGDQAGRGSHRVSANQHHRIGGIPIDEPAKSEHDIHALDDDSRLEV